jgi:hypothetical protein
MLGVICPAWLGSRSDSGLAGTGFPARWACTSGLTYRGGAWARSRCGPTRRTYGGGSDCRATSKSCSSTGHAARRALPSGRAKRSTNQRSSPRGSGVSPAESLTACRRRGARRGAGPVSLAVSRPFLDLSDALLASCNQRLGREATSAAIASGEVDGPHTATVICVPAMEVASRIAWARAGVEVAMTMSGSAPLSVLRGSSAA